MEFVVKFAQCHETFRKAEIESIAELEGLDMTIIEYDADSPICIVELPSLACARKLIQRSILAQSIHELWARGSTYDQLHESVKAISTDRWAPYKEVSFKYDIEHFRGTRSKEKRVAIINSFAYLPFQGPIKMSKPDVIIGIYEVWPEHSVPRGIENPDRIYFSRFIMNSSRDSVLKYDLKKRDYISTTSMDSELSLVTANIALAGPGKIIYDPFVGTGSFPVACAHFGAVAWGSDIDGLSIRGQGGKKSLRGNFEQYGFTDKLGGFFAADLTNTPIRRARLWDSILCDPPYGVREGLKVLGARDPEKMPWLDRWSKENYKLPTYIPPKKPYGFQAMLDNILIFASESLVDRGRLCFWMPTANDIDQEIPIPAHPCLELVSVCVQPFYKWSRRLITYRRLPDEAVSEGALKTYHEARDFDQVEGKTADDLNPFRKGYFNKFQVDN